jgi:cytochrome c-type biogenesis protein CcmH
VIRVLAALMLASHIFFAGVAARSEPHDAEAELEKRVHAFSQQLRCLVCQNETLADSRAELAVDLRREIREQMRAGQSDEQITAFLTERYGDFVLYRPPLKPSTYALWFGPFVFLIGGLLALHRWLRRWLALPEGRPLSASDRARARRLLQARRKEEKDANVAVYRRQLDDMESDLRQGLITNEQFLEDREELEQRLILDLPRDSLAAPG